MPTSGELIKQLESGAYDSAFARLYGADAGRIAAQRTRYADTVRGFEACYGAKEQVSLYSAPGRTEISGNHTDHNHGLVMAAAVDLDIIAVVSKNVGQYVRVQSRGFPSQDVVDLAYLEPVKAEFGKSAALIRGVAAGVAQRNGIVGGFDAYTTSDVLSGSGLSSSAAFEVCMCSILNWEYNAGRFSALEMGMIGQYAENKFFGKPSGLLDQTACAVGSAITIDFADPAAPLVQEIPFDLAAYGYKLVVTDTKGSHANLTDAYAAVRFEMESVAKRFGKQVLREVDIDAFFAAIPSLRPEVGDRAVLRAIHFFEECRRVPLLADAIRSGDFMAFLRLIVESGNSSFEYNQNAYNPQAPDEQGVSLGLALSQLILNEDGAWRLQGGGFAGTIQAFVPQAKLSAYLRTLTAVFGEDACYELSVRNCGAVQVLPE